MIKGNNAVLSLSFLLIFSQLFSQLSNISGIVTANEKPLTGAHLTLDGTGFSSTTDSLGYFQMREVPFGKYAIRVRATDFLEIQKKVEVDHAEIENFNFTLKSIEKTSTIEDVVISGTMKAVKRLESPVPVEVYTPTFFKKNPTPSIFDALQNVNGVRPQLNCNICNTGDIHINDLEGPYTMVLIDGMPIVSSLGTVYGLSGIPNSLVERIEIVKGPASSLYGSEAVGGLINIITKKPQNAPNFSADLMLTTWGEYNVDVGFIFNAGKKATVLTGLNYFNYQNKIDNNHDNFTDVTLQNRISVF